MSKIIIDAKYCGPPGLGNGGYVAGMLSNHVGYDCEVMLKKPTPLGRELRLINKDGGLELMEGSDLLASVSKTTVNLATPPPISIERATMASKQFIGHRGKHPFPNCFVCGPARPKGLRIFVGQVDNTGIYAAPWVPHEYLAKSDLRVRTEFVWAALDCPGAFAIWGTQPAPTLLGKIKCKIIRPPQASEPCVIQAWHIESQGRKHRCGTAIFDEQGNTIALADALWISPRV